jgi:hypothetical protein
MNNIFKHLCVCFGLLSLFLLLIFTQPGYCLAARGGQLQITVTDRDSGKSLSCRMHLKNAAGKPVKPEGIPLFWSDHFVVPGNIMLKLPLGKYTFDMECGPEYLTRHGEFQINDWADDSKPVDLKRFFDMSAQGWWSGDLDVRRSPRDIEALMAAEDLHVAQVVTWRNDKSEWAKQPLPKNPLVTFDANRCYQVMAGSCSRSGTELLLLNLAGPWKGADAASKYFDLKSLSAAREDTALWIDASKPYVWDLPMLIANKQIDSIQVVNSRFCRESLVANEGDGKPRDVKQFPAPQGNALWSQEIYFRVLECGLRIPPSAGSGSGEAPNPVGYNRAYVHIDGTFSDEKWWQGLKAGEVVLTNGPLLAPLVNGELPGHVFRAEAGTKQELEIALTVSSRDPVTYLEIIKDGQVADSIRFDEYAKTGKLPKVRFDRSGWFLIRVVTDVPKTYRFAMTGPYYVEMGGQPRISKQAAQFFLDWVYERARQIKEASPQLGIEALEDQRAARDYWQSLVSKANVE